MKAWKVTGKRTVELTEAPAQQIPQNSVKLKMLTTILDTAEVSLYEKGSENPLILGRQGVGLVAEVGEGVTDVKRGDRVYVRPVYYCGTCSNCKAGKKSQCDKAYTYGKTVDGLMCDFVVVPRSDLIILPSRVAAEEGVFIETVALAITALDKLGIEKGEHLVIAGATMAGLALAQAALYYQAVPILVDRRADRLALAEKMGIYYTINSSEVNPYKKIFSITCGNMSETMVFSLLSGLDAQRSFECLAPYGRAVFMGTIDIEEKIKLNYMDVLKKNVTILPVSGAEDNYMSAVNMIASKAVDVTPFTTKRITFNQVGETLAEVAQNLTEHIAVLVEMDKE